MPIHNDVIVPVCIVCWYLVHYVPGAASLLKLKAVKVVWVVFLGLFRTHAVCNLVKVATNMIEPGPYYPIAIVAPIITGTLLGSGGQFFPFDKGLSPIANGTPWPIQGAFLTATFFHLMVMDMKGILGVAARNVLGTYSEETIKVSIATVHIATCLAQTIFSPDANFFSPVHKFLYLVFQVDGPPSNQKPGTVGWDFRTRLLLEKWTDLSRLLTVIAVIFLHIYATQPPVTIYPGQALGTEGFGLGTCQYLGSVRPCTPFHMQLHKDAKTGAFGLTSYKGYTGNTKEKVWSTQIAAKKPSKVGDVYVTVSSEGAVLLVNSLAADKTEEQLWTSKATCPASKDKMEAGKHKPYLTLDNRGLPYLSCADGAKAYL